MDFDTWKRRPGTETLSALLVSVEGRVQRICRRILRNDHDADEAKQEVLLEIAKDLGTVEDGARFDQWVGTVAFRTALDRRRMRLRRESREREAAGRSPNGLHRDDALHEGMSKLEDEQRELLIERYFDRRTLREMAARRGISAVAVRKRIAGAQNRLKRSLGMVVGWGMAMKLKAGLVAALLLLATGSIVIARRPTTPMAPADLPTAGPAMTSNAPSVVVGDSVPITVPSMPAEDRRREWTLEKLRDYVSGMRAHVDLMGREPSTRHDFPPELTRLWQQINEHAEMSVADPAKGMFDPMACIDYMMSSEGGEFRPSLVHLLTLAVYTEMTTEYAPSGPLLSRLLPMTRGSRSDKTAFLYLSQNLGRSNREIADFALECAQGSDGGLQEDGMSVLAVQGTKGNLREFITRHENYLRQVAQEGPALGNRRFFAFGDRERIMGGAWAALSVVDTPEVDEFLVQYIEASKENRIGLAENLARNAPRIMTSHTNRLFALVQQAADQPERTPAFVVLRFSLSLPTHACLDGLRYVRSRFPAGDEVRGIDALIGLVESGRTSEAIIQMQRLAEQGGGGLNLIRQLAQLPPK